MGRNGHNRTGAVAHHYVVRNPDWDLFTIGGVDGKGSSRFAGFVFVKLGTLEVRLGSAGLFVGFDCFGLLGSRDLIDERVLGSEDHIGGPEEGIGSSGEDSNRFAIDREIDFCSFATTNPVALKSFDGFRPVEWFEFVD